MVPLRLTALGLFMACAADPSPPPEPIELAPPSGPTAGAEARVDLAAPEPADSSMGPAQHAQLCVDLRAAEAAGLLDLVQELVAIAAPDAMPAEFLQGLPTRTDHLGLAWWTALQSSDGWELLVAELDPAGPTGALPEPHRIDDSYLSVGTAAGMTASAEWSSVSREALISCSHSVAAGMVQQLEGIRLAGRDLTLTYGSADIRPMPNDPRLQVTADLELASEEQAAALESELRRGLDRARRQLILRSVFGATSVSREGAHVLIDSRLTPAHLRLLIRGLLLGGAPTTTATTP